MLRHARPVLVLSCLLVGLLVTGCGYDWSSLFPPKPADDSPTEEPLDPGSPDSPAIPDEPDPPPVNVDDDPDTGAVVYRGTGTAELLAGWTRPDSPKEDVGDVTFSVSGTDALTLTVTFAVDAGWEIVDSAVWVAASASSLADPESTPPLRNTPDSLSTSGIHTYTIPLDLAALSPASDGSIPVFVATRASVSYVYAAVDALDWSLPVGPVTVRLVQPGAGSYFDATVSGTADFDGLYRSWCVDPSRTVPTRVDIPVTLVSSYSDQVNLLYLLVGNSENLDILNYFVNADWASLLEASLYARLDAADLQVAVWTIVDADMLGTVSVPHDQDVVDAVVSMAHAAGEGFRPVAGQRAAVIADPNNLEPDGTAQVFMLECPLTYSYTREETTWAHAGSGAWVRYVEFRLAPETP